MKFFGNKTRELKGILETKVKWSFTTLGRKRHKSISLYAIMEFEKRWDAKV